jgi:hypothetical protein
MSDSRNVQFGCGLCAPESWCNYDVSPALRLQRIPAIGRLFVGRFGAFPKNVRYGDIIKGLPEPDQSCKAVYCSHVLEHLSFSDLHTAMTNVHKILISGGVFRFVLPDLEYLAKAYLEMREPDACSWFMREAHLGIECRPRGLVSILREMFGNSKHLWLWDFKGLKSSLESYGFERIRRAQFGDSDLPQFQDVEQKHRWDNALGIECFKY